MFTFFSILVWLAGANAHLSAFHQGMYCLNGSQKGVVNLNANQMVTPLWMLELNEWWFHHSSNCDEFPPTAGDFLDVPAGGTFTVEIADNQAHTTLSYNGKYTSEWPDGGSHPNFNEILDSNKCITSPNMHTTNQSMAAGTAFAISYNSDITKVTQENLVVFSVRHNTPWPRVTTYNVPAEMPPCPPGGCICAWGWIPNGCGEPNMYMQGFKCQVSNSTSKIPLASPKPAVWCEGQPNNCTKGAKQMIAWNQKTGNNIQVDGFDLAGNHKSPGYNSKCGFSDGAQNDIFATPPSSGSSKKRRLTDDDDYNNSILLETSETDTVLATDISSHRRNSHSFRYAAKDKVRW